MKPRILNTARLSFPLASALSLALASSSAFAAALTWSGGNGDWNNGVAGGWNAAWNNATPDTGTFNVAGGGTVTVKSAITTGNAALAFTAGNYTLLSDGATERVITLGNTNVTLGNGVTTTIGSKATLTRPSASALIFDGDTKASSTLNIDSGGKALVGNAGVTIREATANVNTGGTIQNESSFIVGDTVGGATLNVLGGMVNAGVGNAAMSANIILGSNSSGVSSTVNLKITGGSLGFATPNNTTTRGIRVGGLSTGTTAVVTGTIDVEGGIVSVATIFEQNTQHVSTLNLGGTGTLKALINNPNFLAVDNIWIKAGSVTFDTNGKTITVTKPLATDISSLGGGLTLNDTTAFKGSLTLSATPTYTGPTLVTAGKLVAPSTHAGTGALTVSANAKLGVVATGTSQWQPASLTLANSCTLEFSNVQNPGTTTAPLAPTAAVGTVSGVTINLNSISGTVVVGNSYPLLGNAGSTTGYTLGTQPFGVIGILAVSGNTLVYTVQALAAIWTGADATNPTFWDIATTPNWTGKALNNSPVLTYAIGDSVLFDDSATATSPVTVEIQTAVAPGNTVFSNSTKSYTVSGAFGIGGNGTLTKSGSNTLTLATNNSYSGGTFCSGIGILALEHSNAAGSGPIQFASTQSSFPATFTLSGGIDVANPIQFDAATGRNGIYSLDGDTPISGNNTLSGNITIINNAANPIAFNNTNELVTFTVGAPIPNSTTITASSFASTISFRGQGAAGGKGILNSRIDAPNATVDANNDGIWTINSTGNTWALTTLTSAAIFKLGADDALATGAAVNLNGTGSVDLNGRNQTVAGLAGTTTTGSIVNQSTTNDSILALTGLAADQNFPGSVTAGTGGRKTSLVMNSAGRSQTLSGEATYSGDTTVSAGILSFAPASPPDALNANGNNDASTVTIAATGATLDLAYTGTDKVAKLVIGTELAPGVYGNSLSVFPVIPRAEITGSGTLTVDPGFSAWIAGTGFTNGTVPLSQQGPDADPDNDGISNLVEYAIAGQDPTVGNPTIGTFDGTLLSFSKRLDATALTYAIQDSTDLGLADAWAEVGSYTENTASTISYTLTPGTPVKNFLRLQVLGN